EPVARAEIDFGCGHPGVPMDHPIALRCAGVVNGALRGRPGHGEPPPRCPRIRSGHMFGPPFAHRVPHSIHWVQEREVVMNPKSTIRVLVAPALMFLGLLAPGGSL